MAMEDALPPGLYIVATPIGNLGDLSPRAKLLAHVGSKARMTVYHDHSSEADRDAILARLASQAVVLVSDAGTPLISDPGYKLVRAARQAGLAVHTVPGPSAVIAALTLAGLPTDRFMFAGFLPSKAKARADTIAELSALRATLVFYESGPRLAESLGALYQGLGAREAAIAREITKLHEECVTGTLDVLAERYAKVAPKGEIVIVVAPPAERAEASDDELDRALGEALQSSSPSRAAADVAAGLGVPRKRAYARALELSKA